MVADTLDAYVRGGDGTWLFASRILKPLFTGGDVPAMRDRVKRMAEGAKAGA